MFAKKANNVCEKKSEKTLVCRKKHYLCRRIYVPFGKNKQLLFENGIEQRPLWWWHRKRPQSITPCVRICTPAEGVAFVSQWCLEMNVKTFDQVKDEVIGIRGTGRRDALERELEALRIGMQIRNAREKQNLTQSQLAERIDKKRTFISRIENDGSNLTVKTLIDIVEKGLGGKLDILVQA